MNIEDLLYFLSGTTPTEINPTPGFSPATKRKGPGVLNTFEPQTETERCLIAAALPLFGKYVPEQHRAFRVVLYHTYREQGFTWDDLRDYFPDWVLPP